jgi:hypothetical protein
VRESGVFYVDAGCSLNDNDAASKRFLDYVEMAQRLHGLFFRLGKEHLGRRWIKLATLHYFEKTNNVELKSTQLCVAGIFAISKSSQGLELLEKWSELMTLQEGNLLLDAAPGETQLHEFIEHRHDQSILTGLIEKSAFAILDDETYFEGSWKGRALNYPIWATRLRSGFSSTSTSAIWKAVRKVERSLYGRE